MKFYSFGFLLQNRGVVICWLPLRLASKLKFHTFLCCKFFPQTLNKFNLCSFQREKNPSLVPPGSVPLQNGPFCQQQLSLPRDPACQLQYGVPLDSDFRLLLKRNTLTLIASETLKNNKLTKIVPWEHCPRGLLLGCSPEICNFPSFSLRKIKLTLIKDPITNINHIDTHIGRLIKFGNYRSLYIEL